MNISLDFIFGFSIGFGIADAETLATAGIQWGFHIDVGIVRIICYKE